jgi:3-deoxy-D-manno-octulosonic-acid transferase
MRRFLDLFYVLTLVLLTPWLVFKSWMTGKYRRGLGDKALGRAFLREGNEPCVWFHAVSLGEVLLLRQIIAGFRQRHPNWRVVLSTTTDTGYDEAKRRYPDLAVFWWPFDFSWAVRRALANVRPDLVVLAEAELWPNFLAAARLANIPVAVVNARLSPRSLRRWRRLDFRPFRLAQSLFSLVRLWAVQTPQYADHLAQIGVSYDRLRVTGSVKWDGVEQDRTNPYTRTLRQLFALDDKALVFVAGSTQPPEEEIALKIYRHLLTKFPMLRLILVPRQPERFGPVADLVGRQGLPVVRRSTCAAASPARAVGAVPPVVVVDTVGELGAVWGLADVAFVGGSLDGRRGGQNVIEPAAYGAAVLFGPHVWNFRDAVNRLLQANAAIQVRDADELAEHVEQLLADKTSRDRLGEAARLLVRQQRGATARTLDILDELVGETRCARRSAA